MGKALLPELGHGDLPEGFSAQPWASVHFGQSLQVIDLSASPRNLSFLDCK